MFQIGRTFSAYDFVINVFFISTVIMLCLLENDFIRVIDELERQDMLSSEYVYLHPAPYMYENLKQLWTYQSENSDSEPIEIRKRAFQYIKIVRIFLFILKCSALSAQSCVYTNISN